MPQIVNPIDPDDPEGKLPRWVVLPESKSYYAKSVSLNTYFDLASNAAESQLGVDLSNFQYLCFISAGPMMKPNLQGIASSGTGRYNMYEVSLYVPPYFFSHIGSHAHEFGHLLGLYHKKQSSTYWNLMGYSANGPDYKGACPSGLSPYDRAEKLKWVQYNSIQSDTSLTLTYDYNNPIYYRMQVPNSSVYYIIENRLREGFDLWTANDPSYVSSDPPNIDPNGNLGGLLIWKYGKYLVTADIEYSNTDDLPNTPEDFLNLARDPFPFSQQDGAGSGMNFNDHTTPGTNFYSSCSYFAINNITWNSDNSSTTVDILLDYDPPPVAPTGFYIEGSTGDFPYLHWDPNSECDLEGYKVYRSLSLSPYYLIATVSDNYYIDYEIAIGGRFDPRACYYIKAYDSANQNS